MRCLLEGQKFMTYSKGALQAAREIQWAIQPDTTPTMLEIAEIISRCTRDQEKTELLRKTQAAIAMILPLAEGYLKQAPTHPDNAKLETARGVLAAAEALLKDEPAGVPEREGL